MKMPVGIEMCLPEVADFKNLLGVDRGFLQGKFHLISSSGSGCAEELEIDLKLSCLNPNMHLFVR
jgi:hypothetical protein